MQAIDLYFSDRDTRHLIRISGENDKIEGAEILRGVPTSSGQITFSSVYLKQQADERRRLCEVAVKKLRGNRNLAERIVGWLFQTVSKEDYH